MIDSIKIPTETSNEVTDTISSEVIRREVIGIGIRGIEDDAEQPAIGGTRKMDFRGKMVSCRMSTPIRHSRDEGEEVLREEITGSGFRIFFLPNIIYLKVKIKPKLSKLGFGSLLLGTTGFFNLILKATISKKTTRPKDYYDNVTTIVTFIYRV